MLQIVVISLINLWVGRLCAININEKSCSIIVSTGKSLFYPASMSVSDVVGAVYHQNIFFYFIIPKKGVNNPGFTEKISNKCTRVIDSSNLG